MNLKNYTVKDEQVELIALLLINTNGKTTNLEIKNQFRSSGFFINQSEVSAAMQRLEDKKIFNSTNNGQYKTFTFGKSLNTVTVSKSQANPGSLAQAKGRGVRTASLQGLKTPLSGNFSSTAIIKEVSKVYKGAWEVRDGNNDSSVLYMHKTISRGQAISKFAKETGVKYDDVRCRKVK